MNAIHWVVLAVIGFGASMLVGSSVALAVGGMMVAALIVALATSRPIKAQVAGEREIDRTLLCVGESALVRVRVTARGPFAMRWVLVHDTIPALTVHEGATGRLTAGGTGASSEFFYRLTFPQRGVYPVGPLRASHGDVLGLRIASCEDGGVDEVAVHPRIIPVPEFHLNSNRPFGERRADPRASEDPTRPAGVRAYVRGDPQKRVHWRATARVGSLMSRVYDGSSQPLYFLAVNRNRDEYTEGSRYELAHTVAASLGAHLARNRQDVGLMTDVVLEADVGEWHVERFLERLARSPMTQDSFANQLLELRRYLPWRATLVIITERLEHEAAGLLHQMAVAGASLGVVVIGDPVETEGSVMRAAALGASVMRIQTEADLERTTFQRAR